jgi:MFS family permease
MKTIINRDFTRLFYGQAVSRVGDFVFDTTLALWIGTKLGKDKSWAPLAMSGALMSALIATVAIAPAAGVFADRWNRKHTMLRMDALRAVLVGGLGVLAFLPVHDLPIGVWIALIYVTVFGVNAAGAFFGPSRMAVIGDLVQGDADRARAAGLTQTSDALAGIIGPPLAAPLLIPGGAQWAMIVNALSYVVSFLTITSVRLTDHTGTEAAPKADFRAEFRAGLAFFAKTRVLVVLLVVGAISNFGAQALNTLDVFFATRNLHAAPKLFGLLGMAVGIGSIIGGLLAGRTVARVGTVRVIWLTIGSSGVLFALYARQTTIWAALPIIFATGVPVAMVNAAIEPLVFQVTPRELLGRVVSVVSPIMSVVQLGSTLVVGWLMSSVMLHFHAQVGGLHMGPIDTLFTITGLLFVLAAGYAFVMLPRGVTAPRSPERMARLDAQRSET